VCTVSWLHEPGGYQVFCNRDEKRSRSAALPPEVFERGGIRWLAPRDPDGGGTWTGVNEAGVALCLLNKPAAGGERRERSRGLLVWELLDSLSAEEAAERLRRGSPDPRSFAPFSLLAMEVSRPALIAEWDGRRLCVTEDGESRMPLTSSSFDPEGVAARRRAEFRGLAARHGRIDGRMLLEYQRSHGPRPGPYSVCMHRGGARTVSLTRIRAVPGRVELHYHPDPHSEDRYAITISREAARAA
jgi:hypothetical protein